MAETWKWAANGNLIAVDENDDVLRTVVVGYSSSPEGTCPEFGDRELLALAPGLYAEVYAATCFDDHVGFCPRCDMESGELCADARAMWREQYHSRRAALKKARGE